MIHYISNETLNLERLEVIISEGVKLKLSEEAVVNIEKSYTYLQNRFKKTQQTRLRMLLALLVLTQTGKYFLKKYQKTNTIC
ncbi:hypothetical protein CCAN12_330013 [Capnocytophaga canimorsus]|uniref:Uncharacterized protein n=1 Tax=Capnocytophaga canimorsus TaxID=28188 RepID=A0A0B7H3J2_9FLAO|nr:hypothetical protein [Capnocytophaga canimorsus]CEN33099.1 hypothetical protein CCAN12_330013 [Capnocytophaga canimorsus]